MLKKILILVSLAASSIHSMEKSTINPGANASPISSIPSELLPLVFKHGVMSNDFITSLKAFLSWKNTNRNFNLIASSAISRSSEFFRDLSSEERKKLTPVKNIRLEELFDRCICPKPFNNKMADDPTLRYSGPDLGSSFFGYLKQYVLMLLAQDRLSLAHTYFLHSIANSTENSLVGNIGLCLPLALSVNDRPLVLITHLCASMARIQKAWRNILAYNPVHAEHLLDISSLHWMYSRNKPVLSRETLLDITDDRLSNPHNYPELHSLHKEPKELAQFGYNSHQDRILRRMILLEDFEGLIAPEDDTIGRHFCGNAVESNTEKGLLESIYQENNEATAGYFQALSESASILSFKTFALALGMAISQKRSKLLSVLARCGRVTFLNEGLIGCAQLAIKLNDKSSLEILLNLPEFNSSSELNRIFLLERNTLYTPDTAIRLLLLNWAKENGTLPFLEHLGLLNSMFEKPDCTDFQMREPEIRLACYCGTLHATDIAKITDLYFLHELLAVAYTQKHRKIGDLLEEKIESLR